MSVENKNRVPESYESLYSYAQKIVNRFDKRYDFSCSVEKIDSSVVESENNLLRVRLFKSFETLQKEVLKEDLPDVDKSTPIGERGLVARNELKDTLDEIVEFVASDPMTVRVVRNEVVPAFPDLKGIIDLEVSSHG